MMRGSRLRLVIGGLSWLLIEAVNLAQEAPSAPPNPPSPLSSSTNVPARARRPFAGLPPRGHSLPAAQRDELAATLQQQAARLRLLTRDSSTAAESWGDVACLLKAVELALRHDEFYAASDDAIPARLLQIAASRWDDNDRLPPYVAGQFARPFNGPAWFDETRQRNPRPPNRLA